MSLGGPALAAHQEYSAWGFHPSWTGPALETDGWFFAGESPDNNEVMLLKPVGRFTKSATTRKMWVRFEQSNVRPASSVYVEEIRCTTKQLKIIQATSYYNNNLDGPVESSNAASDAQWQYAIPGSFGESIVWNSCP
jgi:hypothetical protein